MRNLQELCLGGGGADYGETKILCSLKKGVLPHIPPINI